MQKEKFEKLEELTDHEWDLKDVEEGRFPDLQHAESVWKILDGINQIEMELDIFTKVQSDAIINAKTMVELEDFIGRLNDFAKYVADFCQIEEKE